MTHKSWDITGERFGRLIAIRREGKDHRGNALWRCCCDCGGERLTATVSLRRGNTKSCGCLAEEQLVRARKNIDTTGEKNRHYKHGKFGTRIHKIWDGMIQRCHNPKCKDYPNWGARGIKVCDSWREFTNFYKEMGDAPEAMSLDRIDNSKGYSKSNCRWADQKTQHRNKRNNLRLTIRGKTQCLSAWVEELGVGPDRVKTLAREAAQP